MSCSLRAIVNRIKVGERGFDDGTIIPDLRKTPSPLAHRRERLFAFMNQQTVAVGRKPSGSSRPNVTGRLAPFRFEILYGVAPCRRIELRMEAEMSRKHICKTVIATQAGG